MIEPGPSPRLISPGGAETPLVPHLGPRKGTHCQQESPQDSLTACQVLNVALGNPEL